MDGRKHNRSGVHHNNKLRTVNRVWRPVNKLSTQVSSNEEFSVVEVVDKVGEDVHSCSSTKISSAHDDVEVASAVIEATKFNACSSASQENGDKGLGEETVASNEKHSVSVEVGASLLRFIRGKGYRVHYRIYSENEIGVKIKIPLSKRENSIIIEGLSVESVSRASEKIQAIIDEYARIIQKLGFPAKFKFSFPDFVSSLVFSRSQQTQDSSDHVKFQLPKCSAI